MEGLRLSQYSERGGAPAQYLLHKNNVSVKLPRSRLVITLPRGVSHSNVVCLPVPPGSAESSRVESEATRRQLYVCMYVCMYIHAM